MTKLAARHRRELTELLGVPPDINRVPSAFWKKVKDETSTTLATALILIWMSESLEQGVGYMDFDEKGSIWSGNRAEWVADKYASWSEQEITRKLDALGSEAISRMSRRQVDDLIRPTFGPRRTARIAEFETNKAISGSRMHIGSDGEEGEVDYIWNLGDTVANCRWCVLVQGFGREVWAPFADGPPSHFGCGCWLTKIDGLADNTGAPSYDELLLAAQEVGLFIPTGIALP
jgi:hypothetical protein